MIFLLDTDTCILFMKGRPQVLANFGKHGPGTVFLSAISYHELLYGALHSGAVQKHLAVVAGFVAPIPVLSFHQASARHFSKSVSHWPPLGKPLARSTPSSPTMPWSINSLWLLEIPAGSRG